jgi:hypothetical protein
MTSVWFSPAPSEITVSRISLDFDLRAADLFFRELVVPGLGRIWFARQLSWPLAALALHEELANHGPNAPKPTAICHGIEALACKLQYVANPDQDTRSRRILGSRAFGRDENSEVWTFQQLHQRRNYVQNTHRQAATRAINVERGLGFARGSRFDLLELEPVGRDLANAFLDQHVGQGGTTLRRWLVGWLNSDKTPPDSRDSFLRALSPEHPTQDERESVRARLLDADTQNTKEAKEKRQRLAHAVGRAAKMRDIERDIVIRLREAGHSEQANQVIAARAFGAVLDRARDVIVVLTSDRLGIARRPESVSVLVKDRKLGSAIGDLRAATKNYVDKAKTAKVNEPTSRAFADAVVAADDGAAIRLMVRRAGEVLGLADGSVGRGPLFRVVDGIDDATDLADGAASIEPDRTGRTFRIANFHSLLRDVDPPGAR